MGILAEWPSRRIRNRAHLCSAAVQLPIRQGIIPKARPWGDFFKEEFATIRLDRRVLESCCVNPVGFSAATGRDEVCMEQRTRHIHIHPVGSPLDRIHCLGEMVELFKEQAGARSSMVAGQRPDVRWNAIERIFHRLSVYGCHR